MAEPVTPKTHKLSKTNHVCPDCRRRNLVEIDPVVNGWHLWCPLCQILTGTEEDRVAARREKMPKGALGIVVSVRYPMEAEGAL